MADIEKLETYWRGIGSTFDNFKVKILAGYTPFKQLEGDEKVEAVVLLEFPSTNLAEQWYNSPAYAEIRKLRFEAAEYTAILADSGVVPLEQRMLNLR